MTRARTWWIAAALVAAAIFAMSSLPGNDLAGPWFTGFDKLVHGVVYALLAALCAGGAAARGWPRPAIAAFGIAVATAYGVSDEWHQRFVPGRDASLGDLAADAIGATIGALAIAALRYRRRR